MKSTIIAIGISLLLISATVAAAFFVGNKTEEESASVQTNTADETGEADETQADPLPTPEVYKPEGAVTELEIVDIKEGEGAVVAEGDTIEVHYHGTLAKNGEVFDSSYLRAETISSPLTGVIVGWQEGIPGMKVGGTRRLVIPAEKAYGATGQGSIGPNEDLVFVVELISIIK